MIGRARHHHGWADDVDPFVLRVFIPGALASGFLVSVGLLLGDALRKLRGDGAARRRVALAGAALAEEVRCGAGAGRRSSAGLRPRAVYGVVGLASMGLVAGVAPGAAGNFLAPGGYLSDISWIWAASTLGALAFAAVGVQTLRVAPEWVPVTVGIVGAGVLVRFTLGPEPVGTRLAVIAVVGVVAPVLAAATWRLRGRRGRTDVPPSVRALLAATPLGAPVDPPSRHGPRP